MGTEIYVVMTKEEIRSCPQLPERIAYLGCHFENGVLTDIPDSMPEGSMLLIDDRGPPDKTEEALNSLSPLLHRLSGIYLDFQKNSTGKLFAEIFARLCPSPVGTPFPGIGIPVLPPRPLHRLGKQQRCPFWQEGVLSCWELTLTRQGCRKKEIPRADSFSGYEDEGLFCSYAIQTAQDAVVFTFQNTPGELLREVSHSGAERAFLFYRDMQS